MIESANDVNTLPNPVKDSIGKVITVVTDQDMASFKIDSIIKARIKYTGDVNTPGGINLYMYGIELEIKN